MHTHWDCGSRGAVSQWCWAASEHILSPAQDSIWWLVRCNWSVDYYLSCACQIKIIKMKGGSDREWNVSGLLRCGRVVHAFPLPETDRSLTTLLRRTLCHLENWIPLPTSPLNNTECVTGQDMSPSYKRRQKPGCWEVKKCWRTWASLRADWQLTALSCQKWALQRSSSSRTPKSLATYRHTMTDSASGQL